MVVVMLKFSQSLYLLKMYESLLVSNCVEKKKDKRPNNNAKKA